MSALHVLRLEDRTTPSSFADGKFQFGGWAMTIGGATTSYAFSRAVVTDTAGDVYVTGTFSGTIDFDPSDRMTTLTSTGGADLFLAKYTSAGRLVWARWFDETVAGTSSIRDVAVDATGNAYLTGYCGPLAPIDFAPNDPTTGSLPSHGIQDAFVAKLDAGGGFVWADTFQGQTSGSSSAGDAIAVSPVGRVYVTGHLTASVDLDPSSSVKDIQTTPTGVNAGYVCELKADDGGYVRATKLGGKLTDGNVTPYDVATSADGSVYVVGGYSTKSVTFGTTTLPWNSTTAFTHDAFVVKLNLGIVTWAKNLSARGDDNARGVTTDPAGNVYLAGDFYGAADGYATLSSVGTANNAFLSTFAADGTHRWSKAISGDFMTTSGIAVAGNSVYATGYFTNSAQLDPTKGAKPLTSAGQTDVFVGQWATGDGSFVAEGQIGGAGYDYAEGLAVDGYGRAYVIGSFNGTADLDPTTGKKEQTTTNSFGDMFLDRFTLRQTVDLHAVSAGPGGSPRVKVYNPDGTLRFEFDAYESFFTGGVTVATGDFTGDGIDDIITGAMADGGPRVRIFDGASTGRIPNQIGGPFGSFFAFESIFRGGVSVGVGDVNGDGTPDLITAAGPSGGPRVRVFDGKSSGSEPAQLPGWVGSFFAFESFFRGGVSMAVGDVNGDGSADLVTSAGQGGGPRLRVFDGRAGGTEPAQLPGAIGSFFTRDSGFTGGVNVAIRDVTGDGIADLIVGQASQGSEIQVIDSTTIDGKPVRPIYTFQSLDGSTRGARVAAADVDDDGQAEILVTEGPGGQPRRRVFKVTGDRLTGWDELVYDSGVSNGVFVG